MHTQEEIMDARRRMNVTEELEFLGQSRASVYGVQRTSSFLEHAYHEHLKEQKRESSVQMRRARYGVIIGNGRAFNS